ncbi:MAG: hypothetical protein ACEPOV_03200 [Hyphomicrobiales bacterium]
MGNLIIRKVKYSGDLYFFESPLLNDGINVIIGDNGSGKSTFSYFIEYGLGGYVKPFVKDKNNRNKYTEIVEDTNNYVEIDVFIDDNNYTFKRFLNQNEIFISDNQEIIKLPVNRKNSKVQIFSDWLLNKLSIPVFELNLGTKSWKLNFDHLFRLLCYDQDTSPQKIYKSPASENFITDSVLIRKFIFEILLGISSVEYYELIEDVKNIEKEKELASYIFNEFKNINPTIDCNSGKEEQVKSLEIELEKLISERNLYQKGNEKVDEKAAYLSKLQSKLVNVELKISEKAVKRKSVQIELSKIENLFRLLKEEILEIKKIIFTHDKLNLFSMELCPFCMSKKKPKKGVCICGCKINDDGYEKFVYTSAEYTKILKHKEKSLETIQIAIDAYKANNNNLESEISQLENQSLQSKKELTSAIRALEHSNNSNFIDSINEKIFKLQQEIHNSKERHSKFIEYNILEKDFLKKKGSLNQKKKVLNRTEKDFKVLNRKTIAEFNKIYNSLMLLSSCSCNYAEIDDDYMPIIDTGEYKNTSANVPKRLMYYFTILSLALKLKNVKHPKLLIIDTPETGGIDADNLNNDIKLLEKAIELSKNSPNNRVDKFQVILTTGIKKFPNEYKDKVKIQFNTNTEEYILRKR